MTEIRLRCTYCGETGEAKSLTITGNRIIAMCAKCENGTVIHGE